MLLVKLLVTPEVGETGEDNKPNTKVTLSISQEKVTFNGDVTQMDRAFDCKSIGYEFNSHLLHKLDFFYSINNTDIFLNFKTTINSYIFIL